MLAILLISAKYKKVFSFIKYLVTNTYNYLKANIIKANKCLKSQYGRLKPKAFKQGINPNVDDLYKEEATAKAAAKAAAKKDSNAQGNADQEAGKGARRERQGDKDNKGNEDDKGNKGDKSKEEDGGNKKDTVKYIIINN